jgi:lipopolysaccharide transport system permease protein
MLLVYTFVFKGVFNSTWGGREERNFDFSLLLFIGLIIYNFFSECISKSPTLIISNVNYVKKIIYPLEILPWINIFASLFHSLVSFAVLLLMYTLIIGLPKATVLFLPIVFMPLIFLTLGLSWLLSSTGVYLRDLSQLIGVFLNLTMFLSPIFYPISAFPAWASPLVYINPLAIIIEQSRNVLFWGKHPDILMVAINYIVTICIAYIGFVWFQKTRSGFADVL